MSLIKIIRIALHEWQCVYQRNEINYHTTLNIDKQILQIKFLDADWIIPTVESENIRPAPIIT